MNYKQEKHNKMKRFTLILIFGALLVLSTDVRAALLQWTVADGGNDHWYDVISYNANWENAKIDAQNRYGYLATLTSAQENAFVWNNFPNNLYFLGGYQTNRDLEPGGNWAWVSGEPWSYTNWHPNEPNDGVGYPILHEEYLEFKGITTNGEWNDIDDRLRAGYIIEYNSKPVPIPSTVWLLVPNLFGLVVFGRKSKN